MHGTIPKEGIIFIRM